LNLVEKIKGSRTLATSSNQKKKFLDMWGKRGFALRHWQDFVRSMELWEDSMSDVAPYNQLKILRLEEHGRYWQVWRVAYGDKLAPTTNYSFAYCQLGACSDHERTCSNQECSAY
jgi:hypothetical protein